MKLEEVILRDTRANQPAFATTPIGSLYYVTDEEVTERNSGAAWEDVTDGTVAPAAGTITSAMLRDSAAVSVIGRSANSSGVPADIAAAANDRLLARTGDTVAFQQLSVGMVPDTTITPAKLTTAAKTHTIGFVFDGGGTVLEIDMYSASVRIPIGGTLVSWSVMAQEVGDIEFEVYADAPGTTNPPTTQITNAGISPALTGGASDFAEGSDLTSWTTTVTSGHAYRAKIVSTSDDITLVTLQLTFTGS